MMRKKLAGHLALLIAASIVTIPALAAAPVADVSLGAVHVEWQPTADFAGMTLRVSGPLGVVEQRFAAGENPQFDLRSLETVADGLYTWEVVAAPRLDDGVRRAMAEARAAGDGAAEGRLRASGALPDAGDMVQSGSFRVAGGAILQPTAETEPRPAVRRVTSGATGGETRRVTAEDQVIPDDLIVQGSVCVGFDCVNNESFGFDTIRLKENNTRIKFEDTSAGTFPTTDWQLTANDSASGGANKFSIEDVTAARVPFTIEGGSTTNSIYVDSTGRVGFRTSTPVLDLHVSTSNTPGIRLEQTNAGGFTAQTWDIAGNEANFFVRDVTGGSRLPLRVRPGAPTSSIDIANDGDVGMGTASPDEDLHVTDSDGTTQVLIEETSGTESQRTMFKMSNNGPVTFLLEDRTGFSWDLSAQDNGFVINRGGSGVNELRIDNSGNLFVGGTQMTVPDYVFSPTYELMPIAELKRFLDSNRHLPNVPNAEEITSGGLNLTQFPLRLLEKVEELTLYTIDQHSQIGELRSENEALKARLAAIEQLLKPARPAQ